MILRLLIVALVVLSVYGSLRSFERRPGRRTAGLTTGLTVITGPGCSTCSTLIATLATSTPDLAPAVIDIADGRVHGLGVRSLPTVFVVDRDGDVLLRRSGRSTLTDFHQITATARAVA